MNLISIQKQINEAQFNSNKLGYNFCVVKKGRKYIVEKYTNQTNYVYISY